MSREPSTEGSGREDGFRQVCPPSLGAHTPPPNLGPLWDYCTPYFLVPENKPDVSVVRGGTFNGEGNILAESPPSVMLMTQSKHTQPAEVQSVQARRAVCGCSGPWEKVEVLSLSPRCPRPNPQNLQIYYTAKGDGGSSWN